MTFPAASCVQELLHARMGAHDEWLVCPHDSRRNADAAVSTCSSLFGQAFAYSKRIASFAGPGAPVVLILSNGPPFAAAFFGVLLANRVPVPFPPPSFTTGTAESHEQRLKLVVRDCQAGLVLVDDIPGASGQASDVNGVPVLSLSQLGSLPPSNVDTWWAKRSDTALLQYTSGSTGSPRGVELSHGNLLANVEGIGRAASATADDVAVSWLPLFHDMGLIGALLFTLGWGMRLVLLTPREFIAHPATWLWAISRFAGTLSPAPNFAFRLCASRIPESALVGLDLSSWRIAFNGSETVQPASVSAFVERFRPMGLRERVVWPVYGLAENALAVTFPSMTEPMVVDRVRRAELEQDGTAIPSPAGVLARDVVGVGVPLGGQRVRISRSGARSAADRLVGSVEVAGPCVMKGYYKNPDSTREAITEDGWLRTGDRGYLVSGTLFIVGREKDVIKRHGAVLDASDLQREACMVPSVRDVAAFDVPDPETGAESLVLAVETDLLDGSELETLRCSVVLALSKRCGARPDRIAWVKPGELPRTTSGKVRHSEARARYLQGTFSSTGEMVGNASLAAAGAPKVLGATTVECPSPADEGHSFTANGSAMDARGLVTPGEMKGS